MTPTTLAHSDDTLERRRQLIQMLGWLILAALAATPLVIEIEPTRSATLPTISTISVISLRLPGRAGTRQ